MSQIKRLKLLTVLLIGAAVIVGAVGWRLKTDINKEYTVIATVIASPAEENSQAAKHDEYILEGNDGKTHHISTLKGETPMPADAIETCLSIDALKTHDKVEFLLPASPVHKNTSSDRYYTTCHEGRIKDNQKYFIRYAQTAG